MFSGIVETVGMITNVVLQDGCKHYTITPVTAMSDLVIGESISINGACLTVTHFTPTTFDVTVVPETLRLTNLDRLNVGDGANLERSLKLNDRLGGHFVQGHIDGSGEIIELACDNSNAWIVKIKMPRNLAKYIVNKGYITLDGMSITVIEAASEWFTVTLIPHTQAVTIAKQYLVGTFINIEVDSMGKYIEKLLGVH